MVKDRLFRNGSLVSILVIVPVSILLYYLHANVILTFLVIAAALAAITRILAESTRIIADRVSNTVAALANVTFGNAVEFFVAIFALRQGLVQMVKASIIGSIIINVLLLVGLSMLRDQIGIDPRQRNGLIIHR